MDMATQGAKGVNEVHKVPDYEKSAYIASIEISKNSAL